MNNTLFPDTEVKLEDLFLEIKYDGPSFNGVMNIQDLGNELLGVEYCLTKIIKDLIKDSSELNQDDINSLQILTEGFVNNCFKKKIKFFFDEIENRPVLIGNLTRILITTILSYTATQTIQINLNPNDTKSMLKYTKIPIEQYQQIKTLPIPDNAKKIIASNLLDKKYREESAKIIMPLKNDNDSLESSSPSLREPVVINKGNKDGFFVIELNDEINELEIEHIQTIDGRINSINLDATKNKIGFKINNEGNEIHCHLSEELDINDYKNGYLGEWVKITGNVSQVGENIKEIEILKLEKATQYGQTNIPYKE